MGTDWDNFCCTPNSGDCCGPGSWCCSHAGEHEHPELGAMWDDTHDADWDAYARQLAAQAHTNALLARNLKGADK